MKIVQVLAGYTLGRADSVRKFMGKKKLKDLQKEREVFLNGCPAEGNKPGVDGAVKRGLDADVCNKLWDEMEKFGSYAFNKSHAAAYAHVSYQTAYLKCHYRPEFLTAVLNNRITNADEIKNYVTYAKEEKIDVLPPDINKSQTYFSVKDGKIRFGLAALKNVGISVIDLIIEERNRNGEYKSLADFLNRNDSSAHNKRCLESLILSGAFDCFGVKRSQLMQVYSSIVDRISSDRKRQATGQFSMFEDIALQQEDLNIDYPNIPEYDDQTKLKLEKEVAGVYMSGHPLSKHVDKLSKFSLTSDMLAVEPEEASSDEDDENKDTGINGLQDGEEITCGGIIVELKKVLSKKSNKEMAIAKLEDLYGTIDLMLFPNIYAKFKNDINVDSLVMIKGKLSIRDGERASVLIDSIEPLSDGVQEEKVVVEKPKTLYLKYDIQNVELHNDIYNLLSEYKGITPVVVRCATTNKVYKLNLWVDATGTLLDEVHAYVKDEFIKLQ